MPNQLGFKYAQRCRNEDKKYTHHLRRNHIKKLARESMNHDDKYFDTKNDGRDGPFYSYWDIPHGPNQKGRKLKTKKRNRERDYKNKMLDYLK